MLWQSRVSPGQHFIIWWFQLNNLSVNYLQKCCVLFIPTASQPPPKIPAVVHRTSSITNEDHENAVLSKSEVHKDAFKSNGCMFFYKTSVSCDNDVIPKRLTSLISLALPSPSAALPPMQGEHHHVKHFCKSLCATPNWFGSTWSNHLFVSTPSQIQTQSPLPHSNAFSQWTLSIWL
jgi:hypothetical protein